MSLAIVQAAGAQDTLTAEGVIQAVNTAENSILVDTGSATITIYCIPYNYLAKKFKLYPAEGDQVKIDYFVRTFSDGTFKNSRLPITGYLYRGAG